MPKREWTVLHVFQWQTHIAWRNDSFPSIVWKHENNNYFLLSVFVYTLTWVYLHPHIIYVEDILFPSLSWRGWVCQPPSKFLSNVPLRWSTPLQWLFAPLWPLLSFLLKKLCDSCILASCLWGGFITWWRHRHWVLCLLTVCVTDDLQVVWLKHQSSFLKQTIMALLTWAFATAGVVHWPKVEAVNPELSNHTSCILALSVYLSL